MFQAIFKRKDKEEDAEKKKRSAERRAARAAAEKEAKANEPKIVDAILKLNNYRMLTAAKKFPDNMEIVKLDGLLKGVDREALQNSWRLLQGRGYETALRFSRRVFHEFADRHERMHKLLRESKDWNGNEDAVQAHAFFLTRYFDDVINALNGTYTRPMPIPSAREIAKRHYCLIQRGQLADTTWESFGRTLGTVLFSQKHVDLEMHKYSLRAWRTLVKVLTEEWIIGAQQAGRRSQRTVTARFVNQTSVSEPLSLKAKTRISTGSVPVEGNNPTKKPLTSSTSTVPVSLTNTHRTQTDLDTGPISTRLCNLMTDIAGQPTVAGSLARRARARTQSETLADVADHPTPIYASSRHSKRLTRSASVRVGSRGRGGGGRTTTVRRRSSMEDRVQRTGGNQLLPPEEQQHDHRLQRSASAKARFSGTRGGTGTILKSGVGHMPSSRHGTLRRRNETLVSFSDEQESQKPQQQQQQQNNPQNALSTTTTTTTTHQKEPGLVMTIASSSAHNSPSRTRLSAPADLTNCYHRQKVAAKLENNLIPRRSLQSKTQQQLIVNGCNNNELLNAPTSDDSTNKPTTQLCETSPGATNTTRVDVIEL